MSVGGLVGVGAPYSPITPYTETTPNQEKRSDSSPVGESSVAPSDVEQGIPPRPPEGPSQTVPLGDLFSQMAPVGSGGASPVNGIDVDALMGPLLEFKEAEQKLIVDRAGLKISAQEYEDGIRELQKAYTEKTGLPGPIGAADPGIAVEKDLLKREKEERIMRLENDLVRQEVSPSEIRKAVKELEAQYDQKIASLIAKPIIATRGV